MYVILQKQNTFLFFHLHAVCFFLQFLLIYHISGKYLNFSRFVYARKWAEKITHHLILLRVIK